MMTYNKSKPTAVVVFSLLSCYLALFVASVRAQHGFSNGDHGNGGDGDLVVTGSDVYHDDHASGFLWINAQSGTNELYVQVPRSGGIDRTGVLWPDINPFQVGDELLLIQSANFRGDDTVTESDSPSRVGQWETARVASVTPYDGRVPTWTYHPEDRVFKVQVSSPLRNSYFRTHPDEPAYKYEDCRDLSLCPTASFAQVMKVPNYRNVLIESNARLTAPGYDGMIGGIVAFKASGTVDLRGTIDVDAKGYLGGEGGHCDVSTDKNCWRHEVWGKQEWGICRNDCDHAYDADIYIKGNGTIRDLYSNVESPHRASTYKTPIYTPESECPRGLDLQQYGGWFIVINQAGYNLGSLLGLQDGWTVSTRFRMQGSFQGGSIFSAPRQGDGTGFFVQVRPTTGGANIVAGLCCSRETVNDGPEPMLTSADLGVWHHVTVVVTKIPAEFGYQMTVYLDGVRRGFMTTTTVWNMPNGAPYNMRIGQNVDPYSLNFNYIGQLADIRIWKKPLGASEAADVASCYAQHPSRPGLKGSPGGSFRGPYPSGGSTEEDVAHWQVSGGGRGGAVWTHRGGAGGHGTQGWQSLNPAVVDKDSAPGGRLGNHNLTSLFFGAGGGGGAGTSTASESLIKPVDPEMLSRGLFGGRGGNGGGIVLIGARTFNWAGRITARGESMIRAGSELLERRGGAGAGGTVAISADSLDIATGCPECRSHSQGPNPVFYRPHPVRDFFSTSPLAPGTEGLKKSWQVESGAEGSSIKSHWITANFGGSYLLRPGYEWVNYYASAIFKLTSASYASAGVIVRNNKRAMITVTIHRNAGSNGYIRIGLLERTNGFNGGTGAWRQDIQIPLSGPLPSNIETEYQLRVQVKDEGNNVVVTCWLDDDSPVIRTLANANNLVPHGTAGLYIGGGWTAGANSPRFHFRDLVITDTLPERATLPGGSSVPVDPLLAGRASLDLRGGLGVQIPADGRDNYDDDCSGRSCKEVEHSPWNNGGDGRFRFFGPVVNGNPSTSPSTLDYFRGIADVHAELASSEFDSATTGAPAEVYEYGIDAELEEDFPDQDLVLDETVVSEDQWIGDIDASTSIPAGTDRIVVQLTGVTVDPSNNNLPKHLKIGSLVQIESMGRSTFPDVGPSALNDTAPAWRWERARVKEIIHDNAISLTLVLDTPLRQEFPGGSSLFTVPRFNVIRVVGDYLGYGNEKPSPYSRQRLQQLALDAKRVIVYGIGSLRMDGLGQYGGPGTTCQSGSPASSLCPQSEKPEDGSSGLGAFGTHYLSGSNVCNEYGVGAPGIYTRVARGPGFDIGAGNGGGGGYGTAGTSGTSVVCGSSTSINDNGCNFPQSSPSTSNGGRGGGTLDTYDLGFSLYPGSGGGSPASVCLLALLSSPRASGGRAGGVIAVIAQEVLLDKDSLLSARGESGGVATKNALAGGAGSGGSVYFETHHVTALGTSIDTSGGAGTEVSADIVSGSGGLGKFAIACSFYNGEDCGTVATPPVYLNYSVGEVHPEDECPSDTEKYRPGICGCGYADPIPASKTDCIITDADGNRQCYPNGQMVGSCLVCDTAFSVTVLKRVEGTCLIGGQCFSDGDSRVLPSGDTFACEQCDSTINPAEWTPTPFTCKLSQQAGGLVTAELFALGIDYECLQAGQSPQESPCQQCQPSDSEAGLLVPKNEASCQLDGLCGESAPHCFDGACVNSFDLGYTSDNANASSAGITSVTDTDIVSLGTVYEAARAIQVSHIGVPTHAVDTILAAGSTIVLTIRYANGDLAAKAEVNSGTTLSRNGAQSFAQLTALVHLDAGQVVTVEVQASEPLSPTLFDYPAPVSFEQSMCGGVIDPDLYSSLLPISASTSWFSGDSFRDTDLAHELGFVFRAADPATNDPVITTLHASPGDFCKPDARSSIVWQFEDAQGTCANANYGQTVWPEDGPQYWTNAQWFPGLHGGGHFRPLSATSTESGVQGYVVTNGGTCGSDGKARLDGASGSAPEGHDVVATFYAPTGSGNLVISDSSINCVESSLVEIWSGDAKKLSVSCNGPTSFNYGTAGVIGQVSIHIRGGAGRTSSSFTNLGFKVKRTDGIVLADYAADFQQPAPTARWVYGTTCPYDQQTSMDPNGATTGLRPLVARLSTALCPHHVDTVPHGDGWDPLAENWIQGNVIHFAPSSTPPVLALSIKVPAIHSRVVLRDLNLDCAEPITVNVQVGSSLVATAACGSGKECVITQDAAGFVVKQGDGILLSVVGRAGSTSVTINNFSFTFDTPVVVATLVSLRAEPEQGCSIDNVCYANNAINPAQPCLKCDAGNAAGAWTPVFYETCYTCGDNTRGCVCDNTGSCVVDELAGEAPTPPEVTQVTVPEPVVPNTFPGPLAPLSPPSPPALTPPNPLNVDEVVCQDPGIALAELTSGVLNIPSDNPLHKFPGYVTLLQLHMATIRDALTGTPSRLFVGFRFDNDEWLAEADTYSEFNTTANTFNELTTRHGSPGTVCFVSSDIGAALPPIISAVLGINLPNIVLPFGMGDIQSISPTFLSFGVTLESDPQLDGFDCILPVNDVSVLGPVVRIQDGEIKFSYNQRFVNITGQMTFNPPGPGTWGTYDVVADFVFPQDWSTPEVIMQVTSVTPEGEVATIVPSTLELILLEGLLNTDEGTGSFTGQVSPSLPLAGGLGSYNLALDVDTGSDGENSTFSIEMTAVEGQGAITMIPGLLSITPGRLVADSATGVLQGDMSVQAALPILGNMGHYSAILDAQFEPNFQEPSNFNFTLERLDSDKGLITVIPYVLTIDPQFVYISSVEGLFDAKGLVQIGIKELNLDFGTFDTRIIAEFPDGFESDPDIFLTWETTNPTTAHIIPTVAAVQLVRGMVNTTSGDVTATGSISLSVPIINHNLGTYDVDVALNFGPNMVGNTTMVTTFVQNPEEFITLIPGLLSFRISAGELNSEESIFRLAGGVHFTGIDLSGTLDVSWPEEWFGGEPNVTIAVEPIQQSISEIFAKLGASMDGVPFVNDLLDAFYIQSILADVTAGTIEVIIGTDPSKKLTVVPDYIYVNKLRFGVTIGASADPIVKIYGEWALGRVALDLSVVKDDKGDWTVKATAPVVGINELTGKFVGGMPDGLEQFFGVFALNDFEFTAFLDAKSGGATRIFTVVGNPAAVDFLGRTEVVVGKIKGKNLFAFGSDVQVDNILPSIGNLIQVPDLPTYMPIMPSLPGGLTSFLSKFSLDLNINPIDLPSIPLPNILPKGFTLQFALPFSACDTGLCGLIGTWFPYDLLPRINIGKISFSLSADFPSIDFPAIGPFKFSYLTFNVFFNVKNPLSTITLYIAGGFNFMLGNINVDVIGRFAIAPVTQTITLSVAILGWFEEFMFIPFLHIGNLFLEAALGPTVTVAAGGDILLGQNCILDNGASYSPDCVFGSVAVGGGPNDVFAFFEGYNLMLGKIFQIITGQDGILPPPLADSGFIGAVKFSASRIARLMPNGVYIPAGLFYDGQLTVLGLPPVAALIELPLEFSLLETYNATVSAWLPAFEIGNGAVKIQRTATNSAEGPFFRGNLVAGLDVGVRFQAVLSGYVAVANFISFSADVYIVNNGKIAVARSASDVIGFDAVIKYEEKIVLRMPPYQYMSITMSLADFNRKVLDPINDVVDTLINAFSDILEEIPVVGEIIGRAFDFLKALLRTRVDYFHFGQVLGHVLTTVGENMGEFELQGQIFGQEVSISLTLNVLDIANDLSSLFVGFIRDSIGGESRGTPVLPTCDRDEDQELFMCWPKCRGGYNGIAMTCWENCPSGYTDIGLFCKKIETTGVSWPCRKRIFGRCVWRSPGCPSGYANFGFVCVRISIHWKDMYLRSSNGVIDTCLGPVKTSYEASAIVPLCYQPCSDFGDNQISLPFHCVTNVFETLGDQLAPYTGEAFSGAGEAWNAATGWVNDNFGGFTSWF